MDGNGRWAKQQGRERIFGHHNGVEAVRQSLKAAGEAGVKYLTLYAFSTENINRPKEEVDGLMDLLVKTIVAETDELHKNEIRLDAIGSIKDLPGNCHESLLGAMERTKDNTKTRLVLALNYSSEWELTEAVRQIVKENIPPASISAQTIQDHLSTKEIPNPELIIRTGGEKRLSNFLLWQAAYSELYFTDTLWPDFTKEDFLQAIVDFCGRERRFGRTSEQVTA
jgi:undecaprenyl diphosphate synthase